MTPATAKYRSDIDALRAVAVMGIVVFHIWPDALKGGFLGVDLFFVISGYLITSNIVRRRDNDTFRAKDFYLRRIRRLLPASVFMIAVTTLVACIVMVPEDLQAYLKSALASLAQMANIFFAFFSDTSYFASTAAEKPLLHMWFLSVEVQFYLIWPALLLLSLRFLGPKSSVFALLIIAGLSLAHGEYMISRNPDYAYYMLPGRFFQFLAGAIVALALARNFLKPVPSDAINMLFMAVGIIGILACFVLTSENDGFPGISALPLTVFGVLALYSGSGEASPLHRAISWKPIVWVGLISYSLYLWHWPILAFARYSFVNIGLVTGFILLVLMFAISAVSYYLVEKPLRARETPFLRAASIYAIAPLAVAAVIWVWMDRNDGFSPLHGETLQAELSAIEAVEPAHRYPAVLQKASLFKLSELQNDTYVINAQASQGNAPDTLLYGDSNAAQYVGFFRAFAETHNFAFRNVAHSACPPLIGEIEDLLRDRYRRACNFNRNVMADRFNDYETIILGASWQVFADTGDLRTPLMATVRELTESGKAVIIILQMQRMKRYSSDCPRRAVLNPFISCDAHFSFAGPEDYPVNNMLREIASEFDGASVYDPNVWICPDGQCSATRDNKPFYFDDGHIAFEQGEAAGRAIAAEGMPSDLLVILE